ncbi:MAG: ABC transporter ATP-binding protein [Firmicutes bacterium]|nr:ABC transporter ATP-binding protein [Bacillota bacterium]
MRTVLGYYKKYIPAVIGIGLFLFGNAMCELALPGYMSDIINNGVIPGDMAYIREKGLIMILVAAGSSCASIAASLLSSRTAAGSARSIRGDLFKKVTAFSTAELQQFSTASLITRSTNDVQMVQQATTMLLRMAFFAPIMGFGAVIKALQTSVPLSWTVGVALIVVLAIMGISFVAIFPKFKVLQSKLDRVNLIMKERLAGILVVRAFNTEKKEQKRFDIANLDVTGINKFVNKAMSLMMPSITFVMSGVGILIVWVGAHMVDAQELLIGDMLAYLQYAMHVIMSFMFMTMIFMMIPRAAVSAGRIGEVLDVEPTIVEAETPQVIEAPKGVIEFRNVEFKYPDADLAILADINFTAEPGKTTAIIGGTGSGKSTLINLIPRFYDVTEGQILLDGVDIRDLSLSQLRDQIGYVPQKGVLFSGTIADNMRFGKGDATDDEVREAIEIAQATEFVDEKPEGIETEISQGGTNVSGGQKQRLSIARALAKKPKVYIFDDSFSALDFKTDKALRAALADKVKDSTILIVAQRINTILDADQILVLDRGRIVGKGTHSQLMDTCSVYKEIALSQLSEAELERGNV